MAMLLVSKAGPLGLICVSGGHFYLKVLEDRQQFYEKFSILMNIFQGCLVGKTPPGGESDVRMDDR